MRWIEDLSCLERASGPIDMRCPSASHHHNSGRSIPKEAGWTLAAERIAVRRVAACVIVTARRFARAAPRGRRMPSWAQPRMPRRAPGPSIDCAWPQVVRAIRRVRNRGDRSG